MLHLPRLAPAILVAIHLATPQAPRWTPQASGVTARLRGVSAVSPRVAWASGADGTVLRTADGGATWRRLDVPDAGALDFRDVDAVDEATAYILSIGNGPASRIYKTTDAGATWTLQFRNEDPDAFFDAMAFRDARRGFAMSDSVGGAFVVLETSDGGRRWSRVPPAALPPAAAGEGAYAASGTNVAVLGERIWIATTHSRVLRSGDDGRSWTVAATPLASGTSAGIFSIAFRDRARGIVVGGDYKKETEAVKNAAITVDGGRTWTPVSGLSGYRSAVAWVPGAVRTLVAVGPTGADVSVDGGASWTVVPGPGFHAIGFARRTRIGWAVGEKGTVSRVEM